MKEGDKFDIAKCLLQVVIEARPVLFVKFWFNLHLPNKLQELSLAALINTNLRLTSFGVAVGASNRPSHCSLINDEHGRQ